MSNTNPIMFEESPINVRSKLVVKFKKLHPEAMIPKYAKAGDAGLDLVAVTDGHHRDGFIEFGTGLAVEIPNGYVGLIYPRSSISKTDLVLCNSVGVIDSGYRGEIRFRFFEKHNRATQIYKKGDKIGQLIVMPYPYVEMQESDELSDSERGIGGFGSTGV